MKATLLIFLAAVLVTSSSSLGSAGGYDFSLSASATDPFVNTSGSTGSVRNIYLWLTCTEDGISAVEAGVTGTLGVLAFVPQDGVLNAGDPSNLLLAVRGCPQGDDVNLLMGHWLVQDTGGTLCLGPSATNGRIGAVNCEVRPNLTEYPKVIGFSSAGGSPCSTGVYGCVERTGLVVGYGNEVLPPYEFTGIGTDVLFLNGLQYYPRPGEPSAESGVSSEEEGPPPSPPEPRSTRGQHEALMKRFWWVQGNAGVVAFGENYFIHAVSPGAIEGTRELLRQLAAGEVPEDEAWDRSVLKAPHVRESVTRAHR